jgi:hypothetical protein
MLNITAAVRPVRPASRVLCALLLSAMAKDSPKHRHMADCSTETQSLPEMRQSVVAGQWLAGQLRVVLLPSCRLLVLAFDKRVF